ncbi:membrane protein [Azospirillum argentinense]|uniref:Membrane protein n=1 Tax=Azospirillum argentinense TaxID=2970906 RepID=A0A060DJL1_9PROT|nr:membrane protein [Azospirillum argentinense]AIB11178.1 membrane protein [Azospirillum argentinense]EZQ08127.1 membrane protein [Azospirillum argentinense]
MGRGRAYRRWLSGFVAATALLAAIPAAWAVDVPVRAATHKTFGRMVFDWPRQTGYSASVEGNTLVVRFDEPINAALDRTVAALPGYLSGVRIGGDGKTVTFDLKRPVTLKSFRNGNAVALDLTPAAEAPVQNQTPAQAPAPAAKAETPAAPAPARSAGRVTVSAADTPEQSRLSFTWPEGANYTLRRDGASATLLFDRNGTADLAPVAKATLRNIQNVEQFRQANGALAFTFAVPQDAEIKDSKSGRSVVIDVQNPGTRAGLPTSDAANAAPPGATTTTVRPPSAEAAAPLPAVTPPAPARPAAAPPPPKEVAAAPAPAKPEAAKNDPAKPDPAKAEPQGPTLVFDAGGPASIAVYPRAGHLYIVFDKPLPIGAGKAIGAGAGTVGAIEPVPATGGSAFRTRIGPLVWPKIERQGTSWKITPTSRLTGTPPFELKIDPEPDFLLGARLLVRAADAATVVTLSDPDVGDRLQVVPLPVPGNAIPESHRYADLELLPSYQGVVVRPIADAITVRPVKEGVEVTAAGGLHLSPMADAGSRPATAQTASLPPTPSPGGASNTLTPPTDPKPVPSGRRLFDLPAWKKGDLDHYTEARQNLQLNIVNAPDSERPRAQLDLARFYLANGFGQEAIGMMDVLQEAQPDLEGWPEFRALRGAARFLAGNTDAAAEDFAHPNLANNGEAALWRAAIAADRNDWPAAQAGFKAAAPILNSYPDPILTKLATRAAEAALKTGDAPFAKRLLDRIVERGGTDAEERPDVQYLRGLYYAQTNEPERALEQLTASYNSLDRYYRAKAGLALVNLQLAEGHMSPPAAAERLAGLTFTWRGDELEMQIRQRMGEVLIAAGQYADGFNAMKETAALVADTPRAEEITREMSRIFADLYKDGAQKLPTIEALQLYDQFRELTPVGEAGDEVIRQLAERLISVDLLNRAADLLQHQVEYRLSGEDKARVGTRLASVRLLDNKPEDALRALELSNVPNLPADLIGERRLMQAKALAELGRGDEALLLLSEDDSKPANSLRVDIAWRAQKWEAAAFALNKLIGAPPPPTQPINPATSQLVLNRAVALALAGDGTNLNLLRKEFGSAMTNGPDADAFRVLTRPEQALGLIDVNTVRSRVAEVDVFQKFLKNYRGKQSAAIN